jgi:hypothetical protein
LQVSAELPNLLATLHEGLKVFKPFKERKATHEYITAVLGGEKSPAVAFRNHRAFSNQPRDPRTLLFRTIIEQDTNTSPLLSLLREAGIDPKRCFDAVVLPEAAYLSGMLLRPQSDNSTCVYSVFLCALVTDAMAGDDTINVRQSKHARLELQRDDILTDTYRVSIRVNQFIHTYVTSTGNKHAVLDAGISSDRLDTILSTARSELATQLKREWAKSNKERSPRDETKRLKETGVDAEVWGAKVKQDARKRSTPMRPNDRIQSIVKKKLTNRKLASKKAAAPKNISKVQIAEEVEEEEALEAPAPKAHRLSPADLAANPLAQMRSAIPVVMEVHEGWAVFHMAVPIDSVPNPRK